MVLPTWLICRPGPNNIYYAWTFLTLYVIVMALSFLWRFLNGAWRSMRVTSVDHAPVAPTYPHPETPLSDSEMV